MQGIVEVPLGGDDMHERRGAPRDLCHQLGP